MTTSVAAFSNDGIEAIQRKVLLDSVQKIQDDVNTVYEIQRCVDYVKSNKFQRVALQFPDSLLVDSVAIATELDKQTTSQYYVLGDTSYGSCCVDEVAAQHVSADCIIHYGKSCLSPTRRLPVLYVFGQQDIDVEHCFSTFQQLFPDKDSDIVLMYDFVYAHAIDLLADKIKHLYPNVKIAKVNDPASGNFESIANKEETDSLSAKMSSVDGDTTSTAEDEPRTVSKFGRQFTLQNEKSIVDYAMFYIGGESLTLTNLMMTFNLCKFYSYDPETRTGRQETININKALMKRYYKIEQAKDAQVIGIVAGTLGVADYMKVISRLKEMIKKAGKKSYTFVMGKVNVAKMANFSEVDVYVLVACPENSLFDSSEFYKPIVTPFELELACNQAREWTGDYETDFRQLLPGGDSYVDLPESSQQVQTDVSLITGEIRNIGREDADDVVTGSSAVVKRDDVLTVSTKHSTAGEFLASRSWQGLEQKLGETPVVEAIEGQRGIAAGYANEKVGKDDL
ncbi:2-(3-amino-3-carboxypropyl)histidine synthase subunit 2-like [Glandiceps talaboti]